jgi:hypothetical protein
MLAEEEIFFFGPCSLYDFLCAPNDSFFRWAVFSSRFYLIAGFGLREPSIPPEIEGIF